MKALKYKAAVIGAGPSGLAITGTLLDRIASNAAGNAAHGKVLWIDPNFTGGRLNKFKNVPSNTKVNLFVKYAETCESFNSAP